MQQPYFASWPPGEQSRALALNSIPSSSVFSSVDSEPPPCLGDVDAVLLILTRSSLSTSFVNSDNTTGVLQWIGVN